MKIHMANNQIDKHMYRSPINAILDQAYNWCLIAVAA